MVSECGSTMFQPRFSPVDLVTTTTHPFVLERAREAVHLVAGESIELVTPFDNMTKAEVIAVCPDKGALLKTHSCVSQRFGDHDGTCFGCVIRRLGAIAAGVRDVTYRRNPIRDESARAGNLLALLEFCQDYLTRRRSLKSYQVELISNYGRHDLFERHSLDCFAALHRIVKRRGNLTKAVRMIYDHVLGSIGAETLEARLETLTALSVNEQRRVKHRHRR